jgi:hypothetical protein
VSGALQEWLGAMPREAIEARFREMDREIEFLSEMLLLSEERGPRVSCGGRGIKTSPQRERILRVVRDHPDGIGPREVARRLGW